MNPLEITESTREAILKVAQPTRCGAGELIFSQNEMATGFYLICSGEVWLSFKSGNGSELFGRRLGRHSVIGVPAAMTRTEYSMTAEALSEAELANVSIEDLACLMGAPEVALEIVRLLNVEVRSLRETLHSPKLERAVD